MKAAIISLGAVSSKWTYEAMKKYFDKVDNINLKDIRVNISATGMKISYQGKPLPKYDCIFAKGSFRYANILRSITKKLYKESYMPIRSEIFSIGHDKLLTHIELANHNIPMPKTYVTSTISATKEVLDKVNYPIVLKFPTGTQGKGVMFADSHSSASSLLDAMDTLNQSVIIQEFVDTGGSDIRAIVIGDKVVASMVRKAKMGEKRANIHAGGVGEAVILDAHTQRVAVNTAKALGLDICAVDMLEGVKGPVVIEINLSPGLQGITEATGIDVADAIAKELYEQTAKRMNKQVQSVSAEDLVKEATKEAKTETHQVISQLDFRADRILLPPMITKATQFNDNDEYIIEAKEGTLNIKRLM
jgi:ribosomal protein S6--L-glutamate ligase